MIRQARSLAGALPRAVGATGFKPPARLRVWPAAGSRFPVRSLNSAWNPIYFSSTSTTSTSMLRLVAGT